MKIRLLSIAAGLANRLQSGRLARWAVGLEMKVMAENVRKTAQGGGKVDSSSDGVYEAGKLYPNYDAYDAVVYGVNCVHGWGCGCDLRRDIGNLYRRMAGGTRRHAEVGLASPTFAISAVPQNASLLLIDVDEAWLMQGEAMLRSRYDQVSTLLHDVTQPAMAAQQKEQREREVETLGFNFVLHCIPGTLAPESKGSAFRHLKDGFLAENGVIFGSTILGDTAPHTAFGKALMRAFNQNGIFSNREDAEDDLRRSLGAAFTRYEVAVCGCTALFVATDDPARDISLLDKHS